MGIEMKPKDIFNAMLKAIGPHDRYELPDAIELALSSLPGVSHEEAVERAGDRTLQKQVAGHIVNHEKQCAARHLVPRLHLDELDVEPVTAYRIVWGISALREGDLEARKRLAHLDEFRSALVDRVSVTEYQFEDLCTRLLQLLGLKAHATQRSKDGGVDFIGSIPAIQDAERLLLGFLLPLNARVLGESELIVMGQAKRYGLEKKVVVQEIRAFYGAVQFATAYTLKVKAATSAGTTTDYEGNEIRLAEFILRHRYTLKAAGLISYLYVTTGQFTRDVYQLARDTGINLVDGEKLAQILLEKGVGCERDAAGEYQFSMEKLLQFIETGEV